MSTNIETVDLVRIILADSEDEHPTAMYVLDVHEARTLASAVERVIALADKLNREADELKATGQYPDRLITARLEATRIYNALNGEIDD